MFAWKTIVCAPLSFLAFEPMGRKSCSRSSVQRQLEIPAGIIVDAGHNALVLELVEGPTLAERIEQGPIPVDEAIAIAKQIAVALEAGHEAGVIHRDLKPANIKIKEDGTVKRLTEGENSLTPYAFSPDGEQLVHRERHPEESDLSVLSLDGDGSSEPLLITEFNELNADLSPDGQWLAYQSDASDQYEIYVRPLPNADEGLKQLSRGGGTRPLWARDGSELFYLDLGGRLVAVTVLRERTVEFGNPEVILEEAYFFDTVGRTYDVSSDGERCSTHRQDLIPLAQVSRGCRDSTCLMDDTNPYAPPEKAAGQEPDESDPVGFRPRMPPATRTLVYASIGAFVLQVILSPHGPAEFAFVPTQVLEGEIWRSVTHLFVHANLISLVLGVLPVYVFGSDIENQVGSRRYIGAFLRSSFSRPCSY